MSRSTEANASTFVDLHGHPPAESSLTDHASSRMILAALAAFLGAVLLPRLKAYISYRRKMSSFPSPNAGYSVGSFFSSKPRQEFLANAKDLIRKGFSQNKYAFVLRTDFTDVLLLSPDHLPQIRSEERLRGGPYTIQELLGFLPGFEAFGFNDMPYVPDVILSKMNRHLSTVPGSVTEEAEVHLAESWTDQKDWHPVHLHGTMLGLVAQCSIRTFLGPEMCREKRWLNLYTGYTVAAVSAVQALRKWPRPLVSIVHHFHPKARAVRALLSEARGMIKPLHEQRKKDMAAGKPVPSDTLTWFEEATKGQQYDPAVVQLTMALVGLHTTTDLLCQVMLNLTEHPEVVEALRKELVDVVKREGWKQSTFPQLTLMDSVLKETQRLKPVGLAFFKRVATDDIKLDHGVEIPRGAFVAVSNHAMWDPDNYEDPDRFDAHRFLRMPGGSKASSFSSVSAEHTGFGFGMKTCPGRHYVAMQIKIMLAHLLLKYEWRLPDGYKSATFNHGFDLIADPFAQVLIRRRDEELEVALR